MGSIYYMQVLDGNGMLEDVFGQANNASDAPIQTRHWCSVLSWEDCSQGRDKTTRSEKHRLEKFSQTFWD